MNCEKGDKTLSQVDPFAIPSNPTYTEHIAPMMSYYCVSCHNGPTSDPSCATPFYNSMIEIKDGDEGGEDDLNLNSYDCVVKYFNSIISTSFNLISMPPGSAEKMSQQEKGILEAWQTGGFN